MDFKRLGLMLDMSRNAVMNVAALKDFILKISKMGYNTLLLYTEDTYEIPGEPYFGHFRGRYSQAELKEIVSFAKHAGVEMIPCIQTLAHLNAIFRWKVYDKVHDTADILLADEEETYALIDKMFCSVKECFDTKVIHIGMDEAHMVGLGKFLDRFGFQNRFEILSRHLTRVCEMAKAHGFEPLIWADMFFRLANHGQYYAAKDPVVPSPEELNLPDDVAVTYWDYYTTDTARFEKMIRAHKKLERPLWYAGGIWTWKGFAPDNQFSRRSTLAALRACRNEGVENIFFTLWGDNGGECLRTMTLSSIFATARFAQGEENLDTIKAEFEAEFQIPFDAFDLFDLHKETDGVTAAEAVTNPEKYLLFNDPFLGLCDSTVGGWENEYYGQQAEKLEQYASHPQFGAFFRSQALLAKALSRKADLGLLTRKIYQEKDLDRVGFLTNEYDICIKDLSLFLRAFRDVWMKENKAFGFEVQEIRIGGLIQRMLSCRNRLKEWKKFDRPIEELEENTLDLMGDGNKFKKEHLRYPLWGKTVSANLIDKG